MSLVQVFSTAKYADENPNYVPGIGNILLLSDLSGASYYIANYAYQLASSLRPHVLDILNVHSTSDLQLLLDAYGRDKKEMEQSHLMKLLATYLEEVQSRRLAISQHGHNGSDPRGGSLQRNPVKVEMIVDEGDLLSLAQFHAKYHGLVVMGMQGTNISAKKTFGSQAKRIMTKLRGHLILIVPIPYQKFESGYLVWSDIRATSKWIHSMEQLSIRKIVYLVDSQITEDDKYMVYSILKIAKSWDAEIHFVHVDVDVTLKRVAKLSVVNKLLGSPDSNLTEESARIKLLKEEWMHLRDQYAPLIGDFKKVKYSVVEKKEKESVVEVLSDWLDRNPANLVAMLKRRHGVLKDVFRTSVTKCLSEKLSVPFLFLKET